MRRILLLIALLLCGVTAYSLTVPITTYAQSGQVAEILVQSLNVRSGPGTTYRVLGTVRAGERYPVLEQKSGWVRIDFRGQMGWLSGRYLSLTNGNPAPTPAPGNSGTGLTGKIVFATQPGGAIYTVNANGTNLSRVGAGLDPAWSPDGTRIAYADWVTPQGIYVMNADGTGRTRIGDKVLSKAPSWSPNGAEIVYNFQNGGRLQDEEQCFFGFCFTIPKDPYWRLGIITLSTGALREPITDFHSFSPVWRTNGQIIFDGDGGLRQINPTTNEQPITVAADDRLWDPRECAASGKLVATFRQHDHWEVYTLNADGSNLRRLTGSDSVLDDGNPDSVAPEWSPDCSQIIFLTNRDGRWRPYSMNADGMNQVPFLPQVFDGITFDYGYSSDRVFDWTR